MNRSRYPRKIVGINILINTQRGGEKGGGIQLGILWNL